MVVGNKSTHKQKDNSTHTARPPARFQLQRLYVAQMPCKNRKYQSKQARCFDVLL